MCLLTLWSKKKLKKKNYGSTVYPFTLYVSNFFLLSFWNFSFLTLVSILYFTFCISNPFLTIIFQPWNSILFSFQSLLVVEGNKKSLKIKWRELSIDSILTTNNHDFNVYKFIFNILDHHNGLAGWYQQSHHSIYFLCADTVGLIKCPVGYVMQATFQKKLSHKRLAMQETGIKPMISVPMTHMNTFQPLVMKETTLNSFFINRFISPTKSFS